MLDLAEDIFYVANMADLRELYESDFKVKARLRRPAQFTFESKEHIKKSYKVLLRKTLRARSESSLFFGAAENLFFKAHLDYQ